MPLFHSMHFQGSFFPREVKAGEMMVEENGGRATIAERRVSLWYLPDLGFVVDVQTLPIAR